MAVAVGSGSEVDVGSGVGEEGAWPGWEAPVLVRLGTVVGSGVGEEGGWPSWEALVLVRAGTVVGSAGSDVAPGSCAATLPTWSCWQATIMVTASSIRISMRESLTLRCVITLHFVIINGF